MKMDKIIRNIDHGVKLDLAGQVDYMPGQIVSKTLAQDGHRSMTLFAFDRGEEISTHASDGDAMVTVLDGLGKITIGDEETLVKAGETIVMPAGVPHAVFAVEQFKMMLIVIFP